MIFKRLLVFFETKSGLLILGFLATTICGSYLNYQIQTRQSENEHSFQMYKTRLSEAKILQEKLLENSNIRSFYLQQVLTQFAHPEEFKHAAIEKYWSDHVTPSKDQWNKDLYHLHAQARALFTPALADMLLVYEETLSRTHDSVIDKFNEASYKNSMPRSLHGAFVDTHATLYYLMTKCKKPGAAECDQPKLLKLAEDQLNHLEVIQNCLGYRISGELLRYPYGPNANVEIQMPKRCI